MNRVEGSYPTPVLGVSTLAPRNRLRGHAGEQINLRSDPVTKLNRRPSLKWKRRLLGNVSPTEEIKVHQYSRGGKDYKLLQRGSIVWAYIDDEPVSGVGTLSPYWQEGDKLEFTTVNDTTFIVNPRVEVTMLPTTDEANIENVSYINILSALNYGETIKVNVNKAGGGVASVTYTVPDLGTTTPDYDTADKARATKKVAEELALLINSSPITFPNPNYNYTWQVCSPVKIPLEFQAAAAGLQDSYVSNPDYDAGATECEPYITSTGGISGVTARFLGSSVAVWSDDGEWLDVTIETGQGDRSAVTVNKTIEKIDGLPLYAIHGTRITVQPDPTSEKGRYYLEAKGTSESAVVAPTPNDRFMEEVVWVESRAPDQPYAWDKYTLPHVAYFETYNGSTSLRFGPAPLGWDNRETGDDDSNEPPRFLGKTIRSAGYFQNRLVLLSEDTVYMTKTDNIYDWWKSSAVKTLVTDPVGIASSAVNVDRLDYVVPHNKDLLVQSRTSQYKIDGSIAITPQTASLQLTTSYESQTDVPPVALGNSVYFPINYGDSTGIQEYTGKRDAQDTANQITRHVIGYMAGSCKKLAGNANLGMLAILTSNAPDNEVVIYEQNKGRDGNLIQSAWSKWVISETDEIVDILFKNDKLELLVKEGTNLVLKEWDLYSRISTTKEVFLDNLITLQTLDGSRVVVSNGPTHILDAYDLSDPDLIMVQGAGGDVPFSQVEFTISPTNPRLLLLSEDIRADGATEATVYIGKKFRSSYKPTRPFVYDENDVAVTTDRIRIAKYLVNVVNTHEIKMHVESKYSMVEDQVFNSRYVGDLSNQVGEVPLHTGDVQFSYGHDADLADVEFYTDDYLGFNIVGISWQGQYRRSSRRI